jgi:membrane associated rhomboid family serine protease
MTPQTLIIIALTCLISIPAFKNRSIINELIMYPPAINSGQYYRLLTHGFIHADFQHLLFNMFTLYFFGSALETYFAQFGKFTFVIVYLIAIVVATLPSYFKNKNNASYMSLGASGGVSALLFAFIMLAPWATLQIWFIPCPAIIFAVGYVAYSVYMGRQNTDHVNHDAHMYGALCGVLAVIILDKNGIANFIERIQHPAFNF